MKHITVCEGRGCPAKDFCRRFIEYDSYKLESRLYAPPYMVNKGKFECDFFWGKQSEYLFTVLKGILNGKAK